MGVEGVLDTVVSGTIRVNANHHRFAQVDAGAKVVDVDISGIRTSGLTITRLLGRETHGMIALYRETEGIAKTLAAKGWRLNLKDADRDVINLGAGVTGLMGPVHIHLLEIGRALDAL